jgi:hypothetical protein
VTVDKKPIWKPPTRRTFVAMLAAAAVALRTKSEPKKAVLPKWIGHL